VLDSPHLQFTFPTKFKALSVKIFCYRLNPSFFIVLALSDTSRVLGELLCLYTGGHYIFH